MFVKGRKGGFKFLRDNISDTDKIIWFHTASLGEFEQGLPVIKAVKKDMPDFKILVTFFSPSGYEVKKNTADVDLVTYLPMDSTKNVTQFLDIVNPKVAIFVKYEFWPNYLNILKTRNIPTLLVSALFRKDQSFFKWYGNFMRRSLSGFSHFFVQDSTSKHLLNKLGFNNVTVSGDTRFDRVTEIINRNNTLEFMDSFKEDKLCLVAGSTWPEDEAYLIPFLKNSILTNFKTVLVPHNIKENHIQSLKKSFGKQAVFYSERDRVQLSDYQIIIIDTVGLLTKIYSYADIAYVGGGMGSNGLHNTLEPAVFGIPVIIGKNYQSFKEARELVDAGGIISVDNRIEFKKIMNSLIENSNSRKQLGNINSQYISKNKGAVIQIRDFIRTLQQK